MKPIIQVRNLSKQYRIGVKRARYGSLRESIAKATRTPLRALRGARKDKTSTVWALKDVSFDVRPGEIVGVIGRNGAGKSTLLKVLTRITEPTSGEADLYGRVASLLEVGTGFHPELTGRENIYLNGAILGMRKAEIERRFDEIVAFAEVERFLDTPVKHYSSGMYVRLAFAVAAHLEPEILLVDEVLAVGDAEFQRKCLAKIGEVARGGRTVLFVSHNMAAISNLCRRALLLQGGELRSDGGTTEVIAGYLTASDRIGPEIRPMARHRPPWAREIIRDLSLCDSGGGWSSAFGLGQDITVQVQFDVGSGPPLQMPVLGLVLNHSRIGVVGGVSTRMTGASWPKRVWHRGVMMGTLRQPRLLQGTYTVDIWIGDGVEDLDAIVGFLQFDVLPTDYYRTGVTPFSHMGTMIFDAAWRIEPPDDRNGKTGEKK